MTSRPSIAVPSGASTAAGLPSVPDVPDTPSGDPSVFRPAYWSLLSPSGVLAPGGASLLTVSLAAPLRRRVPLDVWAQPGEAASTPYAPDVKAAGWLDPSPSPATITRLAFAEGGERVYGYWRNDGPAPLTMTRLVVDVAPPGDGTDSGNNVDGVVPGRVLVDGGRPSADVWWPSPTVSAGATGVFAWRPGRPLARGAAVTVSARFADGRTVAGQARALWGFPLGVESGTPPHGLGFDMGARARVDHPAWLTAASASTSGAPSTPSGPVAFGVSGDGRDDDSPAGLRLMACVACRHGSVQGDRFKTAEELLRRRERARRRAPWVATIVNPCRVNSEAGCAVFAPAVDALLMNPSVKTTLTPEALADRPVASTARLARIGREASAPGLFYPLVDTAPTGASSRGDGTFVTPGELRARVFTLLAEGADGLLYRHAWTSEDPAARALAAAIPALNADVASMKPWLAIGAAGVTVPWTDRSGLWLSTRLAGERGVLVFLIPENPVDTAADAVLPGKGQPLPASARVRATWSTGSRPVGVRRIAAGEWVTVRDAVFSEGAAEWTVPVPSSAEAYAVLFAADTVADDGVSGGE